MAASLAAKLKAATATDATLIPGSGGEFEVVVNGVLTYSKRSTGSFPDEDALVAEIARTLA